MAEAITVGLNQYRDTRDALWQQTFKATYENPWLKMLTEAAHTTVPERRQAA